MGNQSPDRREVLAVLAKVATVGQFPGFCRWISAAQPSDVDARRSLAYKALFFSSGEYKTVEQLSQLIIPTDDTPGAREAGVAEFIDFMVAHDLELQYPLRKGLAWLDAFAIQKEGGSFSALPEQKQQAVLRRLAYRAQQSPEEIEGQEFFSLFRRYTVLGYYTSRIGLQELAYPGLQFYSASPECPHRDDPEHKHLPVPSF